MPLRDLQLAFLEDYNNFLRAGKHRNEFMNFIADTSILTSEHRLEIYQKSILATHIKTLSDIYPVCKKLVGESFFSKMALCYISDNPSLSPNLCDYGKNFYAVCSLFSQLKHLIYLTDVCHLEWAWHKAYYAADSIKQDFSKLAQLDESLQKKMIFKLPEGATLLYSRFPILKIWEMNQEASSNEDTLFLSENDYYFFVWRDEFKVRIETLDRDEWHLLKIIEKLIPFEDVCHEITETTDIDLITSLPKIVKKGWMCF